MTRVSILESTASQKSDEEQEVQWHYEITPLGRATYSSAFSPEEALVVKSELEKAMQGLVLVDDLQLCYLCSPLFDLPDPPDWMLYVFPFQNSLGDSDGNYERFFDMFCELSPTRKRVAAFVNVTEGFLFSKASGSVSKRANALDSERAAKRLYFALVLSELIAETPLWKVAKKFQVPRYALHAISYI